MIEVEITNYESIEHTKICVEGFTTLTGTNALGKSAVLRAINAALTNSSGTRFIRWGEKFCEVRIKIKEYDILWHKEDGNNFYKINDKIYKKIGKDAPPKEIAEAGFSLLKAGNQKINLNYAQQFFPLFLVDKLDSKGADLLTSVYGLDRLYKAVDLCNKEQRTNSDTLRLREKDQELLDKDLERFKDFEKTKEKVEALKKQKENIEAREKEISRLHNWSGKAQVLAKACSVLQKSLKAKLPSIDSLKEKIKEYSIIEALDTSFTKLSVSIVSLGKVERITLPEKGSAVNIAKDLEKIRSLQNKYIVIKEEVDRLSKIKKVSIPDNKIDTKSIEYLKEKMDILLQGKVDLKNNKKDMDSLSIEIKDIEAELDKYPLCPLCGSKVKHEHS